MTSLRNKMLTSLAAVCAAAGLAGTTVEANAAELLCSARASAVQLTPCLATAEDLASRATLRLLERHPEALGEAEAWGGYLRRSVHNAFYDERRRQSRSRVAAHGQLDDRDDEDALDELAPSCAAVGPELAVVEEFRERLSARDREVLDLLMEGHSDRSIAELERRTRHDVRSSVERIRRAAEHHFGAFESGTATGAA